MDQPKDVEAETWLQNVPKKYQVMDLLECQEDIELVWVNGLLWCKFVLPDRRGKPVFLGHLNESATKRFAPFLEAGFEIDVQVSDINEARHGLQVSIFIDGTEAKQARKEMNARKRAAEKASSPPPKSESPRSKRGCLPFGWLLGR